MKAKNKIYQKQVVVVLIFIFFLNYSFLLFTSSIGYNLETQKYFITNVINKISPQGWGFFTRSPREDLVDVILLSNEFEKFQFMPQNSDPSNFWGLSKKSRMKGFEISLILESIKNLNWYNSEQTKPVFINLPQSSLHYFKKNNKYLLIKYRTVPYLWHKYIQSPPKQYFYIQIK